MKKDCDFVESFLSLKMDLNKINFWQKYIYLDLESFTRNIIVEKILHHLIHHGRPTAPDLMQIKDTPPQLGGQWSLPSIILLLVNYFILLFYCPLIWMKLMQWWEDVLRMEVFLVHLPGRWRVEKSSGLPANFELEFHPVHHLWYYLWPLGTSAGAAVHISEWCLLSLFQQ